MTSRERVNAPDELRPGDRVELVDDEDPTQVAFVDLLWWDGRRWCGTVAGATPACVTPAGDRMLPGDLGCIEHEAYAKGCVFVRRRSREGRVVSRALEVQR